MPILFNEVEQCQLKLESLPAGNNIGHGGSRYGVPSLIGIVPLWCLNDAGVVKQLGYPCCKIDRVLSKEWRKPNIEHVKLRIQS